MTKPQHHDVVVIGAGIAGSTIASELLERGRTVCIVDAEPAPATQCSSHAYAIAHPHVGKGAPRLLRLTRIAFLMAEARWGKVWNQHGIFQPTKKDKIFNQSEVSHHLSTLDLDGGLAEALSAHDAKQVCGINQSGVWMPRGASLNLSEAAVVALKPRANLTCLWNTRILRLEKEGDLWVLFDQQDQRVTSSKKVVIANSVDTNQLVSSIGVRLPLRPVRGQLSIFSIESASPWIARLPKVAMTGDGYCLPATIGNNGTFQWIVGSSFDEGCEDSLAWDSSDDFNREQARGLIDYTKGSLSSLRQHGSFVGIRCVAGDRLPIIGPLTQRPGIFIATALGSRGILWSALAAKLITAQVLEDDFALLTRLGFAADLVAALAPARFFAGTLVAPAALGALASNSKPIFPSVPSAK